MMERVCGPIPQWMVNRTGPPFDKHFTVDSNLYKRNNSYYLWPLVTATTESLQRIQKMKTIDEVVEYPLFADLLKKMMKIDPQNRISCVQAMAHPFFQQLYD